MVFFLLLFSCYSLREMLSPKLKMTDESTIYQFIGMKKACEAVESYYLTSPIIAGSLFSKTDPNNVL